MATLRKKETQGGSIYFVDFYYQGKRIRKSTKTGDKRLAELFLKDIEVKIAKNQFGFDDLENSNIKLTEFIEKYKIYSEGNKAENTFLLDSHSLRVLKEFVGDIYLKNISYKMLEDFKLKRMEQVKSTSVNLEIRHLKAAFEMARKWGYIPSNPFKEVKQIKIKSNNLPKYLTKDQVRKLLDIIPEGNYKDLIQVYLYTGSRRNEALNLTWDDIDLGKGKIVIKETKSGESRIVPINSELNKILKSMDNGTEKLFTYNEDYVNRKFKKYLKKAEIKDWKALTIHNLRHSFASHLVMSGTDLYTVSKLLGHSSIAVTQMYAHLAPDYLKVSVERLKF